MTRNKLNRATIFFLAFTSLALLISCGQSPKEQIVGKWVNNEKNWGFLVESNGMIYEIEKGRVEDDGAMWELNDTEPFELSILDNGRLLAKLQIKFISKDEIEVTRRKETVRLKKTST